MPPDTGNVQKLITAELTWLATQPSNEIDKLRYRAAVLILRDLLSVSWRVDLMQDRIQLVAPEPESHKGLSPEGQKLLKDGVRAELASTRDSQLSSKATQNFVRLLEEPTQGTRHFESVRRLIADGKELAQRLEHINSLPDDQRADAARAAIRPYLVLVDPSQRDPFTGIRFGDIWRYFRHTWSIPYTSSPGRRMLYLVRDAAHPCHAIMAIAALSNAALAVRDRDNYIGWTAEIILKRLTTAVGEGSDEAVEDILTLLESHVERGLGDVDPTGLVDPDEVSTPTGAVLKRLRTSVLAFAQARQRHLQAEDSEPLPLETYVSAQTMRVDSNGGSGRDASLPDEIVPQVADSVLEWDTSAGNRSLKARRQLVFKKRAQILYELLYARREFQRIRNSPLSLAETIAQSLSSEALRSALSFAAFANKREKIGINLLDITTCGAIPPYNDLLGGKLMALLLLSPQVGADYRMRYGDQYSFISSQVKGEKVIRSCDLVMLTTTSLYAVGSSQYNRLTLPAGTFDLEQPTISYRNRPHAAEVDGTSASPRKRLQTSGFGTVHFQGDTTAAVNELATKESGFRDVNSVFGEGHSPKLRKLSAGLAAVGFNPDVLLRHNQPRLLYCVELCEESLRYLSGHKVSLPSYIAQPANTEEATEKIAEFWRQRWLLHRLNTPGVLKRVAAFDSGTFTLQSGHEEQKRKDGTYIVNTSALPFPNNSDSSQNEVSSEATPPFSQKSQPVGLDAEFLQKLYLGSTSYSDRLSPDMLNAVNIRTPLDEFIESKISTGVSVVLTGNAGDGKTHLIRNLRTRLSDAVVIEDASVLEPEEIVRRWNEAIAQSRPICLAANEWPLFQLIQNRASELPILQEVSRQLKNTLIYDRTDGDLSEDQPQIVTVNLGLRNPLAHEFVGAAMDTLLTAANFATCRDCAGDSTCDAARNRDLLMDVAPIRERFVSLLQHLSIYGQHVTVRDVLGLVSYAVFGGRDRAGLAQRHDHNSGFYSQQLFDIRARGKALELLREHLDPAHISHPRWDTRLYYGQTAVQDWAQAEPPLQRCQDRSEFDFAKRRFYFEHVQGADLLQMLNDDEKDFSKLLETTDDLDPARDHIVSAINAFFCRDLDDKVQELTNDLIVWSSHNYDERVPRAFASWGTVDRRQIRLQRPQLAHYLRGAFDYRPDHLRLAVPYQAGNIALVIDYELYHTLMEVQRGLPAVLVDEGKSIRLFRFMSQLEARRESTDIPRIRSYAALSRSVLQLELDTRHRRINSLT